LGLSPKRSINRVDDKVPLADATSASDQHKNTMKSSPAVMQLMAAAYRKGFADGDATKAAGVSEPQRAGGKAHQL